jgi:hypothetical protein
MPAAALQARHRAETGSSRDGDCRAHDQQHDIRRIEVRLLTADVDDPDHGQDRGQHDHTLAAERAADELLPDHVHDDSECYQHCQRGHFDTSIVAWIDAPDAMAPSPRAHRSAVWSPG